jgi:hypothetical protein
MKRERKRGRKGEEKERNKKTIIDRMTGPKREMHHVFEATLQAAAHEKKSLHVTPLMLVCWRSSPFFFSWN